MLQSAKFCRGRTKFEDDLWSGRQKKTGKYFLVNSWSSILHQWIQFILVFYFTSLDSISSCVYIVSVCGLLMVVKDFVSEHIFHVTRQPRMPSPHGILHFQAGVLV